MRSRRHRRRQHQQKEKSEQLELDTTTSGLPDITGGLAEASLYLARITTLRRPAGSATANSWLTSWRSCGRRDAPSPARLILINTTSLTRPAFSTTPDHGFHDRAYSLSHAEMPYSHCPRRLAIGFRHHGIRDPADRNAVACDLRKPPLPQRARSKSLSHIHTLNINNAKQTLPPHSPPNDLDQTPLRNNGHRPCPLSARAPRRS